MTPRHFAQLEGAKTIKTPSFALVDRAIERACERLTMAAVHGKAGLGKTYAVEHAIAIRSEIESHRFDFPERTTPKWLTCDLLELITGVDHDGDHRRLRKTLLKVLAERPRLLIVDETQRLTRACVEHLRHLHDHPETQFGLVLVGGNGCWETLSRHAMLESRLWSRVEFESMSPERVVEIMPAFHSIYREAEAEVLLLVDDYFGHGNFRNWAGFTATAAEICAGHGLETVDEKVARAAFAQHGGGIDAA